MSKWPSFISSVFGVLFFPGKITYFLLIFINGEEKKNHEICPNV